MTLFSATFTADANIELSLYPPEVGLNFERLWADGAQPRLGVIASTDVCGANTSGTNSGVIYRLNGTYSGADYEIAFRAVALNLTANRPGYVLARLMDLENMYALRMTGVAGGVQLYKKLGGTWSALGSAVTVANGSNCKLKVNGSTISFEDDGVEVISVTDGGVSAGYGGLGFGGGAKLVNSTDAAFSGWQIDNLVVTALGSAGNSASIVVGGDGQVQSQASVEVTAIVSDTGNGTVAAQAEPSIIASLVVAGDGSVAAQADPVIDASLAVSGEGSLSAQTDVAVTGSISVSGEGTVSILVQTEDVVYASIVIGGDGSVSSTVITEIDGQAEIGGAGSVSLAASVEIVGEVVLSGVGNIQSTATGIVEAVVSIGGEGQVHIAIEQAGGITITLTAEDGQVASTVSTDLTADMLVAGEGTVTSTVTTLIDASIQLGSEGFVYIAVGLQPTIYAVMHEVTPYQGALTTQDLEATIKPVDLSVQMSTDEITAQPIFKAIQGTLTEV